VDTTETAQLLKTIQATNFVVYVLYDIKRINISITKGST